MVLAHDLCKFLLHSDAGNFMLKRLRQKHHKALIPSIHVKISLHMYMKLAFF